MRFKKGCFGGGGGGGRVGMRGYVMMGWVVGQGYLCFIVNAGCNYLHYRTEGEGPFSSL